MGLLDRLFNRKKPPDRPVTGRPQASPRPDRLPAKPPRTREDPAPMDGPSTVPSEAPQEASSERSSAMPAGKPAAGALVGSPAAPTATATGEKVPEGEVLEEDAIAVVPSPAPVADMGEEGATVPAEEECPAVPPEAALLPAAQPDRSPSGPPPQSGEATKPVFEPALQKQLDAYFARLRAVYPDGVITRLNTGHKKLAERGAALRKRTGQEGDLDAFFALGGFTYRRSAGGRPPLPLPADLSSIAQRLHTQFPNGIPTVMAIRDTDHRLYLDLRALARREDRTVGEFLQAHGFR